MNSPIPIILLELWIAENFSPEESISLLVETDDVPKLNRLSVKDFLWQFYLEFFLRNLHHFKKRIARLFLRSLIKGFREIMYNRDIFVFVELRLRNHRDLKRNAEKVA